VLFLPITLKISILTKKNIRVFYRKPAKNEENLLCSTQNFLSDDVYFTKIIIIYQSRKM